MYCLSNLWIDYHAWLVQEWKFGCSHLATTQVKLEFEKTMENCKELVLMQVHHCKSLMDAEERQIDAIGEISHINLQFTNIER